MHRIVGLLLLAALSLQHGLRLGVVAWWTLNRERIATTRCENRDKPQLNCCGRCVLAKTLRKTDGGDKSPAHSTAERFAKEEPAVLPVSFQWVDRVIAAVPAVYGQAPLPAVLAGAPDAPFHPPQV